MNSRPEFRNDRMKSIVRMTREILRMPSQYAVDHPTFSLNYRYFSSYRDPGGLLSRNNQPPDIWNSQGKSGNVFANPRASSSSPYPGELNPWISNVTEDTPVLTSTGGPVTCGERQISDIVLNPRFQTGPTAGNHSTLRREDSQIILGRPTKTADLGTSL